MSLSDEKRLWWSHIATAGVLVVAAFTLLSAVIPGLLGPRARVLYVEYECSLSAILAVVAVRLKATVAAAAERDSRESGTRNLDGFKVGSRWAAFRNVGNRLWIEPGKLEVLNRKVRAAPLLKPEIA